MNSFVERAREVEIDEIVDMAIEENHAVSIHIDSHGYIYEVTVVIIDVGVYTFRATYRTTH